MYSTTKKQDIQKQGSTEQSSQLLVFDRTQNKEDQNYELYNQVYTHFHKLMNTLKEE